MKIAIYGDSFGCEEPIFQTHHKNLELIGTSWVSLLRQHFNIDNYSVAGSDHYYSFDMFLKNYKKYDLNIFIETSPHRLSTYYNSECIHNHGIDSAEAKLKNENDKNKKKIYKASIDYFCYLQDKNKDKIISKLFREKITMLDPNCLIIDAFGNNGLFNITLMENNVWNLTATYTKKDTFLDLRYCHITKDNNVILFKKIKNCIDHQKKFVFNVNDYVVPTYEEKERYLIQYD